MTPPTTNRTWFWRTLMLSCSASVCATTRASSWSARAGTLTSKDDDSACVERRLLDAQAVGVGGDHPQLLAGRRREDPGQHRTGLVARRRSRDLERGTPRTSRPAARSSPRAPARGTAGSPRRAACGCGRSRCRRRARRPAPADGARATPAVPAASRTTSSSSRAGSTTTPSRTTSASSGTRRPTSMSVARSSQRVRRRRRAGRPRAPGSRCGSRRPWLTAWSWLSRASRSREIFTMNTSEGR